MSRMDTPAKEDRTLCRVSDLPVNGIVECEGIGGTKVCVINAGDRFFACQAACPHEGFALCEGVFDGDLLTCLEHLWQWSLRSGGEPRGLAERPLTMYDVDVENDVVVLKA
jgi:toluene monooxygenase system ferredoxin subunit